MNPQPLITLCLRHKPPQSTCTSLQIPTNAYICMNRYCPNAYTILCNQCKLQHRDHQVKILSIQDIAFLMERLLKMPFKQAGIFISQSVQMLKKVKLVNQFARKIMKILKQLQQQTLDFISMTQTIVSQYAQCKASAVQISQSLTQIQSLQNFNEFRLNHIKKLHKIDYNIQKDRLQYGSLQIKQKQDLRKKNLSFLRRRMQQIKQYSMKIIQVILNNDQSDQQDHDIMQKKKLYQILKNQVGILCRDCKEQDRKEIEIKEKQKQRQKQKQREKSKQRQKSKQKRIQMQKQKQKSIKTDRILQIKQTLNLQQLPQCIPIPIVKQYKQSTTNTDNNILQQLQKYKQLSQQYQKSLKLFQNQLQAANLYQKKIQTDYKSRIYSLQKQRQSLIKQKDILKRAKQQSQKLLQQKSQLYNHYQHRLRDNYQKRTIRYREREEIIRQLAELVQHQRVQGKNSSNNNGRESVQKQKENRTNSKSKRV